VRRAALATRTGPARRAALAFLCEVVTPRVLFRDGVACHRGPVPERCTQSPGFGPLEDNLRSLAARTRLAARVAGAQWGAIGYRQLRDCGISSSTISRWVAAGRLYPRYQGVYTLGHRALPVEGELTAALLAAGPGATLSHATAAWWWRLLEHQPDVIEISVPTRRQCPPGLKLYRRRNLHPVNHRRLPVTPVIQTLLDFASHASVENTRRAIAQGEYHRLIDVRDIPPALGRGRPGSATLAQALKHHQPQLARTWSELEKAFIALCEWAHIPVPEFNTHVCGYRVDAVWREQRVAVELDGLDAHHTAAQIEADHERDLVLRHNRFQTRRYTYQQTTRKRKEVVADLPESVRRLYQR
jgi:very-short-patch-repair endonuclease